MEAIKKLKEKGVRPSLLRTEVLRYLDEHRTHPSVDTIFEDLSPRMPTLSRTSLYNILNLLVEKGLAQAVTIDPRQVRYDGNTDHHAHFLCTACGSLHDVETVPIHLDGGHQVTQTHVYMRGICSECLTNNNNKKNN